MPIKFVDLAKERRSSRREYCTHFPYGYVKCENSPSDCTRCLLGDRIRREAVMQKTKGLLFISSDVLRQTEKGGGDMWWHFPILLSKEAMERLHLSNNIYYQVAVADGGPGVFLKNPVGQIECHLLVDPSKTFTITRNEAYGIPNESACRRFDNFFFYGLEKTVKDKLKARGVWCL